MSEPDNKFFFLNLKKQISKNGKVYYTGKFAYAIDLVAFEKKDGSGDLTVWMKPKDMDQMRQNQPQGPATHPYAPRVAQQNAYAPAQEQRPKPKITPRVQPVQNDEDEYPF